MDAGGSLGNGRYVVRGVLGEGAQGKTFDAVMQDGRPVAIKRFDVRGAKGWKDVELAEREARVLSTIDHPLVPRYIEHFEDDGALYLVMEKVEGETLESIRRREGRLSEDEVRRFLADADRALTYLHGRASPIVHRDIKPRNVVRRPNGSYVIVDFGAVSELLHRRGGNSTVVGTMGFMAPEQFQGRALPSTDIYAVGATALAMLAGADPDTLPHHGLRVDVRGALGNSVSPTMVASLERMLDPDPDHRAPNLGTALDGVRAQSASHRPPPVAARGPAGPPFPAPPPLLGDGSEDAIIKSLRSLVWVLWGLGWVIVPVTFDVLGIESGVPLVMFGSLALVFILSWHKGAALRAILRKMRITSASPAALHGDVRSAPAAQQAPVHHRIDVGPSAQVRVHTADPQTDEHGQTERTSAQTEASRRAQRS